MDNSFDSEEENNSLEEKKDGWFGFFGNLLKKSGSVSNLVGDLLEVRKRERERGEEKKKKKNSKVGEINI
jgi:hypothetical protein